MQKHWDVMRSDTAGENWHEVSGNLPMISASRLTLSRTRTGDGYVVPITSDGLHYVQDGKLRVYRSRTGWK